MKRKRKTLEEILGVDKAKKAKAKMSATWKRKYQEEPELYLRVCAQLKNERQRKNNLKAIQECNRDEEWRKNRSQAISEGNRRRFENPEELRKITNFLTSEEMSNKRLIGNRKIRGCEHNGHWHRSHQEMELCKILFEQYGEKLHPSVTFRGIELDFVIASNINDISTWQKVIEYHPPNKFHKDVSDYPKIRKKQLEERGVFCPLEAILDDEIFRGRT
jgi:hypothetical protein